MAELILVRHGQASFGADDYDRLSELGWRQSRWLGEHFRARGMRFDRVLRGTLRRHEETLRGILEGLDATADAAADAGLNEYDSHALLAAHGGKPEGGDRRAHFRLLREALGAWTEGKLAGDAHEPFEAFRARVLAALEPLREEASAARVLVVTSGGPISTFLAAVTGMPQRMMVELNLQTRNSGISEFRADRRGFRLVSFNTVPHLDRPDRADALTYA